MCVFVYAYVDRQEPTSIVNGGAAHFWLALKVLVFVMFALVLVCLQAAATTVHPNNVDEIRIRFQRDLVKQKCFVPMYTHTHKHTQAHTQTHAHRHTHAYTGTNTQTHTNRHIHIHTQTHT